MTDDLTSDWFHQAALAVGFVAHTEGWLSDSARVQRAVYALYETGEWPPDGVTTPPDPAKRVSEVTKTESV